MRIKRKRKKPKWARKLKAGHPRKVERSTRTRWAKR